MPNTMDNILASIKAAEQKAATEADAEKQDLINEFEQLGITKVEIMFDGSGDSGSIYDVIIDRPEIIDDGTGEEPVSKTSIPPDLEKRVEDWAYKWLEGTGVDWYNNEGGYGTITFDMVNRSFNGEVYYRVESSELGHSAEEAF